MSGAPGAGNSAVAAADKLKFDEVTLGEIAEILAKLFPRTRRRQSSIRIPGTRKEEEFRFEFCFAYLGKLILECRYDGKTSFMYLQEIAGETPQEVAKEIIAAIKEMPRKHREFLSQKRPVLAAAA